MLVRLALLALVAAPLSAQTVAAVGQSPAKAGRFGFALECTEGCTWVEPGIDNSYFRFKGPPKVNVVAPRSAASRGGLRVGDVVREVNGFPVSSVDAGLAIASDTTHRFALTVTTGAGKSRTIALEASPECKGVRNVIVGNHTGDFLNIYLVPTAGGDKTRLIGRASLGESVLTVPLGDSAYRAVPRQISARFVNRTRKVGQRTPDLAREVSFQVVCVE